MGNKKTKNTKKHNWDIGKYKTRNSNKSKIKN